MMFAILSLTMLAQVAVVEARPVSDVLVSLAELARGGDPGTSVTLTLEGGKQISGVVTDLSSGGLAVRDGETIHFVDPAAVVAVSVSVASPAVTAVHRSVSKVDVQRRAEDLARGLTELLGGAPVKFEIAWKSASAPGLGDSGDGLAVIAAALDEAAAGVRLAAADDSARRDLGRRLKRIRVSDQPRAGAAFSGDTLSIGVAPAAGFTGRASAWEVRRALASP